MQHKLYDTSEAQDVENSEGSASTERGGVGEGNLPQPMIAHHYVRL